MADGSKYRPMVIDDEEEQEEEEVKINAPRIKRPTLDGDGDEEEEEEEVKIHVTRRTRRLKTIEDYAPVCLDPVVFEASQRVEFEAVELKAAKELPLNDNREFQRKYKHFREKTVPDHHILSLLAPFVAPAKLEQRKVTNWAGVSLIEDAWLARLGLGADLHRFDADFTNDNKLCSGRWRSGSVPVRSAKTPPVTLVIVYIAWQTTTHDNLLILDHTSKTGFLFEPNGAAFIETYTALLDIFQAAIPDYKMVHMPLTNPGPQAVEIRSSIYTEYLTMMRRGSCSIWCLLFAHVVVLHNQRPYDAMRSLSALDPDAALLTSRGYTSTVMAEFYDPDSKFRHALPLDTKTWPDFAQAMLAKFPSQKNGASKGPGTGALSGRVRQTKEEEVDKTPSLHPALARRQKQGSSTTAAAMMTVYHVPTGLALQPKRGEIDVVQLYLSYATWITLQDKAKVDEMLDKSGRRWFPETIRLALIRHIPTDDRGRYTIAEHVKYLGGLMKQLDLHDKSFYLGANNGLPIPNWNWTLDMLTGILYGPKNKSKIFQLHLYPRATHLTEWHFRDVWKDSKSKTKTKIKPKSGWKSLSDTLLTPPKMMAAKVNLYSYKLSFDNVEYPMPADESDRVYSKVMLSHAPTMKSLPTEETPLLTRIYNFRTFTIKSKEDWEYLYAEFQSQLYHVDDRPKLIKTEEYQLNAILFVLDVIFALRIRHYGEEDKHVSLLIKKDLELPKLPHKTGDFAPYNFSNLKAALPSLVFLNNKGGIYKKLPSILRLAVGHTTLLRLLLRIKKRYENNPQAEDPRFNYWIRSGYLAKPVAATRAKYRQIFEI